MSVGVWPGTVAVCHLQSYSARLGNLAADVVCKIAEPGKHLPRGAAVLLQRRDLIAAR
jgi:hypothetical protein